MQLYVFKTACGNSHKINKAKDFYMFAHSKMLKLHTYIYYIIEACSQIMLDNTM